MNRGTELVPFQIERRLPQAAFLVNRDASILSAFQDWTIRLFCCYAVATR